MNEKASSKDQRYYKQLILPEWGPDAQEKLGSSTVFIAGAGGLGNPVAMYLAAAGIGKIKICDNDTVELSNLNRQILYSESDLGSSKALVSARKLSERNSSITILGLCETITAENLPTLAKDADILIDCLDNFETRYMLNRFCVKTKTPLIHAGIYGFGGQLTFIHPPDTPCLHCLFPEARSTNSIPIIGAAVGIIASFEALEAIKYITGIGTPLKNKLVFFDGFEGEMEYIYTEKDPQCPVCGVTE